MGRSKKKITTSPVLVRRGHVVKSTENSPPMFPKTSITKYQNLSPRAKGEVRARARKTLNQMEHDAGAQALAAKEKLFAGGAGSSAQHTSTPPKKKVNNKGQVVVPYSPDCGLSPDNPGRHGRRSSRCIITDDVTPTKA